MSDPGTGTIRLGLVVLDCPDPAELARFYARLLGAEVEPGGGQTWQTLTGDGVRLAFQRASDYQPPRWPDGPPQQLHLDIDVSDPVAAHDRALLLGAVPLSPTTPPSPEQVDDFRVYADPAGHPFCLVPLLAP